MNDFISRAEALHRLSYIAQKQTSTAKAVKAMLETLPSAQPEIIRCKDCRWGRGICGNIECFADSNIPPEYHGYEWFCPNGERRTDEQDKT